MYHFAFVGVGSISPGRAVPLTSGPDSSRFFSGSSSGLNNVSVGKSDARNKLEKLWRDLFSNPSQWWDHRAGKGTRKFPDFKHKRTGDSLWLDNKLTPAWVDLEIASLKSESSSDIYLRLWVEFFSDPSKWWDHRPRKGNPKSPDFKHKQTGDALWLEDGRTPPWVASEIASLGPVTLQPNVISSLQRLSRHNKAGVYVKTLELFEQMQQEGIEADNYVFAHVLTACGALRALELGRRIHRQIIECGCECNPHLGSSLVDMYAKCGSIEDAWGVFNQLPSRDVVSWTAMILGCVKCGRGSEALELFQQMQHDEVEPDSTTFVALINACASITALDEGRRAHKQIIQSDFESDEYVGSALVDMYAKCGSLKDAWDVFNKMSRRNVVAWTAMILGCVKCGHVQQALELFHDMELDRVEPNSTTFVALLNACAGMRALKEGKWVHKQLIQKGCESNKNVGSSLVDMYCKCGSLEDAWSVFNKMPIRDVVPWTAMILGCVKCGENLKAFELFQQMQLEGVEPNSFTFVGVLNACAGIAALDRGRFIHEQIIQRGLESNVYVGTSLVDMYAKCGSIEDAWNVFKMMPSRNVVGWNALIMGYAMHGQANEAVELFERMSLSGSEINEITFIGLLTACSHGGLVKEGKHYFGCMWSVYGVTPIQEHYTCMVDILGRAGYLEDAEAIVSTMPLKPCAKTWLSLLSACKIHGNVEMGERAFKRVLDLDPTTAAGDTSGFIWCRGEVEQSSHDSENR